MSRPPEIPDEHPHTDEIRSIVKTALKDTSLTANEMNAILRFFLDEASPLFTSQRTYFVMGSDNPYQLRRLRVVENRLNRRILAYAFVLCDLFDPEEIKDLPSFPWIRVKFHLVMTYTTYGVFVFEGQHTGPTVELGETVENDLFFRKSYLLQRTYDTIDQSDIEVSKHEIDVDSPYSAAQYDRFVLFDRAGRLYPWEHETELVSATEKLP